MLLPWSGVVLIFKYDELEMKQAWKQAETMSLEYGICISFAQVLPKLCPSFAQVLPKFVQEYAIIFNIFKSVITFD